MHFRFITAILFAVSIATSSAFAGDLAVLSVSGASNSSISNQGRSVLVEGGLAGSACGFSLENNKTCNSCTSHVTTCAHHGFCACNPQRVSNHLVVRVNLKKADKIVGNAVATVTGHTGTYLLRPVTVGNLGEFADFTWSSICAAMGSSNCENLNGVNSATVHIGIDLNQDGVLSSDEPAVTATFKVVNPGREDFDVYGEPTREGFAAFQPFAGQNEVFIEAVTASGNFPQLSYGARALGMRVFYSDRNVLEAGYDGAIGIFDMPLNNTGVQFKRNEVLGLTNGITYFFHTATVDEAGNVVQFVPGSILPDNCTHPITAPNMDPCFYSATPSLPIPTP